MNKDICDKLICEYMSKIYGFAVSKTSTVDKADELASRITLEVYSSLLRSHGVDNVAAYIYRIAQNVYARFTDERIRSRWCDIDGLAIADEDDFTERVMESETYAKLRVEIAYLSKTRREILMRHYYDGMKLADIAKRMDIPLGTVKWHISGAKNELKEGMETMRNIGKLGLEPIELCNMGHDGRPGKKGDTSDFLAKRITQNIAYAAYHKPRSINEIADELGVSPVFVADEVATLEEYGFMDKVGQDKYRTNIYITVPTSEWANKRHELMCSYAKKVRDLYVPNLIKALKDYDMSEVYIPNGDINLWLWSAILLVLTYETKLVRGITTNYYSRFSVARKDGGHYIANAVVKNEMKITFDESKYCCCGRMDRESQKYPIVAWQLNTYYSPMRTDWRDNLYSDYEYLYEFFTGKIDKTPENIEKYERLKKKGYLTADDKTNLIIIKDSTDRPYKSKLMKTMPEGGDEMRELALSLADDMFELNKTICAEHMHPLCREYAKFGLCSNGIAMRVIELLVADGTLKLPTKEASAGLTTLMFTDKLPE